MFKLYTSRFEPKIVHYNEISTQPKNVSYLFKADPLLNMFSLHLSDSKTGVMSRKCKPAHMLTLQNVPSLTEKGNDSEVIADSCIMRCVSSKFASESQLSTGFSTKVFCSKIYFESGILYRTF